MSAILLFLLTHFIGLSLSCDKLQCLSALSDCCHCLFPGWSGCDVFNATGSFDPSCAGINCEYGTGNICCAVGQASICQCIRGNPTCHCQ